MSMNEYSNFDIDSLENEIQNHPEIYQSSFIINYGYGLPESKKNEALHAFLSFVGSGNILAFLFIQGPYILLTMRSVDHMNKLLASVRQLEVTLSENQTYVLNLFPVLPIPAKVKIMITDIPYHIANRNLNGIRTQIEEVFWNLSGISISREMDGLIPTGNILVKATTNDLKKLHQELQSNLQIVCEGFHGQARFLESSPVGGAVNVNVESTPYAKVYPWK